MRDKNRSDFDGRKTREYVVRAELALGRRMPDGAVVQRVGRSLVICDRKFHRLLRVRLKVLTAGGDPNCDGYCSRCNRVKSRSEFTKLSRAPQGISGICKSCTNLQKRQKRAKARKNWRHHKLLNVRMKVLTGGGNPRRDSWCKRCESVKPRSEFLPSQLTVHGLYYTCKSCRNPSGERRSRPGAGTDSQSVSKAHGSH